MWFKYLAHDFVGESFKRHFMILFLIFSKNAVRLYSNQASASYISYHCVLLARPWEAFLFLRVNISVGVSLHSFG